MSNTTSNRKRIALIDADGILYAAALKGETRCLGNHGEVEQMQLLEIEYIFKDCMERLEQAVEAVNADDAFIILSDRRNFRYDILPSYKGNRKPSLRPIMLDELRAMVDDKAPYKVMLIEGLEADDVCGIAAGTLMASGVETVIVSPDKDLLTIPGKFYQPVATNTSTKGKPQIVDITKEMADDYHYRQMLSGDTTDGYKGCPGIGVVKAQKLVEGWRSEGLTPAAKWEAIVKLYEDKGLTAEDALVQARVSRILRVSDWDPIAKEPRLWTPAS